MATQPTDTESGKVIKKDERITDKRFIYMFEDIGKAKYVREKDGTLRLCTNLEKLFNTVPNKN
jgi:hypothetical protein